MAYREAMDGGSFAIRSRRVTTPEGLRPAAVVVRGGTIARVEAWEALPGREVLDAGDSVLMPGVVDLHVHADDPGRAEWEGFEHATRAAAAGGVTTFVDMPLNSVPPTTSRAGLAAKRAAADGRLAVDVGLWGGLVPENAPLAGETAADDGELATLWREGVLGFKAFLAPSGVDDFPAVGEDELRRALPLLALLGAPLLVHAELPARLDLAWGEAADDARCRSYAAWLASRPPAAEAAAIELVAAIAGEVGARVHVVHVSSAEGVEAVRRARERGVAISAETCPHYLVGCAEEIADGATAWKCAPPVREARHREALYLSGTALTTVGFGDIVPATGALRLVTVAEAATGFAVITGAISYLLSVYPQVSVVRSACARLADARAGEVEEAGPGRLGIPRRPPAVRRLLVSLVHPRPSLRHLRSSRPWPPVTLSPSNTSTPRTNVRRTTPASSRPA
ncbi:MAG TPA: amidohydrolase family protein [Thermoanaerobaculia bacterium]|nr:amidohydrolase family protein [Thermoanaerobaculia bacterium]